MAKMSFKKKWDFARGNKPVELNDLRYDKDVLNALSMSLAKEFVSYKHFTAVGLGAVVFTYDDGKAICPTIAAHHEARGQVATFAITKNWINTAGYMTTAQVLDLFNRGHEMANHSSDHLNYTGITAAQRAAQSDACSDWLELITGVRPVTMIPPQGGWNITCDREWHTRFRSVGLTASPTTNLPVAYPRGEIATRFYRITLDDPANLPRAMELVRLAAVSPIIVSFCAHNFDAPGYMNMADYLPLLDLVQELNVPTLRAREAFGTSGLLANPSFEGDLGGWIDQSTAGATISQVTVVPDAGISGTGALRLTADGTAGQTAICTQSIFATPGPVVFSGRMQVNSGGLLTNDFKIRLRYRDWQDATLSQEEFFPVLNGANWARFDQAFTVPDGCKHLSVDLCATPAATRSGSINADHVHLGPKRLGSLG